MAKHRFLSIFLIIGIFFITTQQKILAMGSSNFSVDWDSMNSGGGENAASTNYQTKDTVGEGGTGLGTSSNFQVNAGYRAGDLIASSTSSGGGGGGGGGSGSTVVSAPVISNIQVINITPGSAQITWDTDKAANSVVSYGINSAHASGTVSSAALTTSHSISLTGLTPNTIYYFIVSSTDGTPLTTVSPEDKFQTANDTTPPVLSNIQISSIAQTSALVTWDTDEVATSLVAYGTSVFYTNTASSPGSAVQHAVTLSGLTAGTTYHIQISSIDPWANTGVSGDIVFSTLTDTTPPTNVSNLQTIPGDTTITLTWDMPTDPDLAGVYVVQQLNGYPTDVNDGVQIYKGSGTSVTDSGLVNGTLYFYGVYAFDATGNIASGALTKETPNGTSPPPPPASTSTPPVLPPSSPAPPPPPSSGTTTTGVSNSTNPPASPASSSSSPGVISGGVSGSGGSSTSTASNIPAPAGSTGSSTSLVVQISVAYFAQNNSLPLIPDSQGSVGLLAGANMTVVATPDPLFGSPFSVVIDVGGSLYALQPSPAGDAYSASFRVPPPGTYSMQVQATYGSGLTAVQQNILVSQAPGVVVEQGVAGPSDVVIPEASVQLFQDMNGVWVPYGAVQTAQDGSFAYVVPNGRYYVEVEKEGYRKVATSPYEVTKNVFNDRAALVRIPTAAIVPPDAPLIEKAQVVAQNVIEEVEYRAKIVREVLEDPRVQTTNAVVAPTLLAVAVVNTATAASLFNAFAYLQLLFTQPLLLLGRGKKRKWGIVFNSLSKQPIDLAIVRLLDATTGFVVQTKVTDQFGRYAFVVKQGSYRLEVTKPGYIFPTAHLKGKIEDTAYPELYQPGNPFIVTDTTVVALNIPLDPIAVTETPRRVLWRKSLMAVRNGLAFSAVPLSVVAFAVTPRPASALLCIFQIGAYALFHRLARPKQAERWGTVTGGKTNKPLSQVVVRVFDSKFNKLLETQVTDRNGKYGFFVRRNIYYLTAEKAGYQKYISAEIDLQNQDGVLIDQNIVLQEIGSHSLSTG